MSLADDILCTMPLPAPISPVRRVRLTDRKVRPKPLRPRAKPGQGPKYLAGVAYRAANKEEIARNKAAWGKRNRTRRRVYLREWTRKKRGGPTARYHFGADNKGAKLTVAQVAEMRARYAAGGISMLALGQHYGVAQSRVSKIIRGLAWPVAVSTQQGEQ